MQLQVICACVVTLVASVSVGWAKSDKLRDQDPLAVAFGTMPYIFGMRLSPDGRKVSTLVYAPDDDPAGIVIDLKTGTSKPVIKGPKEFDLTWCDWANNDRLLCGFSGVYKNGHYYLGLTRLVALNADGSKSRVLLQRKLQGEFTQFQDRIVDWMDDDPKHVLVQEPTEGGTGLSEVDIYSGKTKLNKRKRANVYYWMSDGRGDPRLYKYLTRDEAKWMYRLSDEDSFKPLASAKAGGEDFGFSPVGFGENPDELLVLKPYEGRNALWAMDLRQEKPDRLVFAHPTVDVDGVLEVGKYKRMVAAAYTTDRSHLAFFDRELEGIINRVGEFYSGKSVGIVGESWDKRYYLMKVDSDTDPGSYHRLDVQTGVLLNIGSVRPLLDGHTLANKRPIKYAADDGTMIPGYLTRPPGREAKNLPTIILPHGGPHSRETGGFDWLSQYLAAKGYAVLQPNFRGSAGYGEEWMGKSGWREWRRTLGDITDGAHWLVAEGIADPNRLCVVGWSYGGYAALMSAVEHSDLYKCSASVAGVSDPWRLIKDERYFVGSKFDEEFIGTEDEVLNAGSPLKRVADVSIPVLLFHGEEDMVVPVHHSEKVHEALLDAGKSSELHVYDHTGHSIDRTGYRIDMLTRMSEFLDRHIGH